LNRRFSDYVPLFLTAGAIVILDQASKYLIRANLAMGEVYRPDLWISQFVRFVHLHNRGAAIGTSPGMGIFSMVVAILVSAVIIYLYPRIPPQERLVRLAMALLLGGALGNLIDRLHQGYVTDFISLLNIPVLNLADLSISVGVVVLFIGLWQQEQKKKRQQQPASQAEDPEDKPDTGRSLNLQIQSKDSQGE
jgi:signal peptidase II